MIKFWLILSILGAENAATVHAWLPAPANVATNLLRTRPTTVTARHMSAVEINPRLTSKPTLVDDGRIVEISLDAGASTYQFHAMWLRDACRDQDSVVADAGERKLIATPVGPLSHVDPTMLKATNAEWNLETEELKVTWNEASEKVKTSLFSKAFLKRYADRVGRKVIHSDCSEITSNEEDSSSPWCTHDDIPDWLEPYTGYPDAPAPAACVPWSPSSPEDLFRRFNHAKVMQDPKEVLELIETLLKGEGVAFIDNVPPTQDASELTSFIQHALGGLQKDPTRDEANWKIVHTPEAASVSYDPAKRLYQHTDSSVPPHGIPALVLSMHYVKGYGANTLTDGYAIAKELQQTDPKGYKLLCTYGYDGERDFAASRVDSTQTIAKGLVIPRKHPIFVTDKKGNVSRLQYNEVFRMPLTLPFDVFPKWFQAFSKFVSMIHDSEVTVPMEENTILLMNNWRVLHGRAGNRASPDRHVVGGTIVREAVYSRGMQLARALIRDEPGHYSA